MNAVYVAPDLRNVMRLTQGRSKMVLADRGVLRTKSVHVRTQSVVCAAFQSQRRRRDRAQNRYSKDLAALRPDASVTFAQHYALCCALTLLNTEALCIIAIVSHYHPSESQWS